MQEQWQRQIGEEPADEAFLMNEVAAMILTSPSYCPYMYDQCEAV